MFSLALLFLVASAHGYSYQSGSYSSGSAGSSQMSSGSSGGSYMSSSGHSGAASAYSGSSASSSSSSSSWSDVTSVCQQYYSSEVTHIQEIESVIDTVFQGTSSCSGISLYNAIYSWEHSTHQVAISSQFLSIIHTFEQYCQSTTTISITQVHQVLVEVIQTGSISSMITTSGSITSGGYDPAVVPVMPSGPSVILGPAPVIPADHELHILPQLPTLHKDDHEDELLKKKLYLLHKLISDLHQEILTRRQLRIQRKRDLRTRIMPFLMAQLMSPDPFHFNPQYQVIAPNQVTPTINRLVNRIIRLKRRLTTSRNRTMKRKIVRQIRRNFKRVTKQLFKNPHTHFSTYKKQFPKPIRGQPLFPAGIFNPFTTAPCLRKVFSRKQRRTLRKYKVIRRRRVVRRKTVHRRRVIKKRFINRRRTFHRKHVVHKKRTFRRRVIHKRRNFNRRIFRKVQKRRVVRRRVNRRRIIRRRRVVRRKRVVRRRRVIRRRVVRRKRVTRRKIVRRKRIVNRRRIIRRRKVTKRKHVVNRRRVIRRRRIVNRRRIVRRRRVVNRQRRVVRRVSRRVLRRVNRPFGTPVVMAPTPVFPAQPTSTLSFPATLRPGMPSFPSSPNSPFFTTPFNPAVFDQFPTQINVIFAKPIIPQIANVLMTMLADVLKSQPWWPSLKPKFYDTIYPVLVTGFEKVYMQYAMASPDAPQIQPVYPRTTSSVSSSTTVSWQTIVSHSPIPGWSTIVSDISSDSSYTSTDVTYLTQLGSVLGYYCGGSSPTGAMFYQALDSWYQHYSSQCSSTVSQAVYSMEQYFQSHSSETISVSSFVSSCYSTFHSHSSSFSMSSSSSTSSSSSSSSNGSYSSGSGYGASSNVVYH